MKWNIWKLISKKVSVLKKAVCLLLVLVSRVIHQDEGESGTKSKNIEPLDYRSRSKIRNKLTAFNRVCLGMKHIKYNCAFNYLGNWTGLTKTNIDKIHNFWNATNHNFMWDKYVAMYNSYIYASKAFTCTMPKMFDCKSPVALAYVFINCARPNLRSIMIYFFSNGLNFWMHIPCENEN